METALVSSLRAQFSARYCVLAILANILLARQQVMSHAMGRTLVLPPEKRFYLLGKADHRQKNEFGFGDFFHLDSIAVEHEG